jgi:hypothetical protein
MRVSGSVTFTRRLASDSGSGGVGLRPVSLRPCSVSHLARQARVPRDQRPVQRDHPDRYQPRPRAQRKHLREDVRERLLVPNPEPSNRRVIRHPVGADHPERHILTATSLDRTRRPLTNRVGVQEQRDHHRRLVRRPTPPVIAIVGVEPAQIDRVDRVNHKPSEMVLRQPLAQARRQQQLLITVTRKEVPRHHPPPRPKTTTTQSSSQPRTTTPAPPGVCATASQRGFCLPFG